MNTAAATIECRAEGPATVFYPSGMWRLSDVSGIRDALGALQLQTGSRVVLDGSRLQALDTAAAFTLLRYDPLGTEAAVSAREMSAALRNIGTDVERLARRADALLAGGDDELRATAQALRAAADSVGAAAGRLRDPQQAIFGPAEGGLGPGERAR